jgi:predicted O-methyltransferase YrrM
MILSNLKKIIVSLIDWFYLKSYDFYIFGKKKIDNGETYSELFLKIKDEKYLEIENLEKKMNHFLEKKWLDDLALKTQIVKKKSKLNYSHGRALYSILCNYLQNIIDKNINENVTILETGTARGFSAICMSKALNDKKISGKVITIDVLGHYKKMFWNCIEDETGQKSRFELISKWQKELENIIFLQGRSSVVLKLIGLTRINFAFLDGQHDGETIKQEFKFIKDKQKKGDIIFFDDINKDYFNELYNFVSEIKKSNKYLVNYIQVDQDRIYALATKN